MKTPTVLALLALVAGCHPAPPPERSSVPISNHGFQLDQLFVDDRGDTIYRFYDQGDWRYYVVAPDGHAQMVPSTRTTRDTTDGTIEPGFGVGVGIGGVRGGGGRR